MKIKLQALLKGILYTIIALSCFILISGSVITFWPRAGGLHVSHSFMDICIAGTWVIAIIMQGLIHGLFNLHNTLLNGYI